MDILCSQHRAASSQRAQARPDSLPPLFVVSNRAGLRGDQTTGFARPRRCCDPAPIPAFQLGVASLS